MKIKANDNQDFEWHFEMMEYEQGVYYFCAPDGTKITAIFPMNAGRPIEDENNAHLYVKDFKTRHWHSEFIGSLEFAICIGNEYIRRYLKQRVRITTKPDPIDCFFEFDKLLELKAKK